MPRGPGTGNRKRKVKLTAAGDAGGSMLLAAGLGPIQRAYIKVSTRCSGASEADQHLGKRTGGDGLLGAAHCLDFSAATVFCLAA